MKLRKVIRPASTIRVSVPLSSSKSESNRALIIKALSGDQLQIKNLASSQDTQTLQQILHDFKNGASSFDVGPAGTTFRFLTAFFALQENKEIVLTGSERMKERPVGILVDALGQLGAQIEYLEKDGFPPLRINGRKLAGTSLSMDPGVSSQFVSALLMIGPLLEQGLTIVFEKEPVSKPYLGMTILMMKAAGAKVEWNGNSVEVYPGNYSVTEIEVESDWSSASYWFEICALSEKSEIHLLGLKEKSLQADRKCVELFEELGVESAFTSQGLLLKNKADGVLSFVHDLEDTPDIAQTLACTCAAKGIYARLSGLKTLRIKETDRITALMNELKKFAVTSHSEGDDVLEIDPGSLHHPFEKISTYHDHRVAMSFAPLALECEELLIEDPDVVKKSYPEYWEHLQLAGFRWIDIN